MVFIINIAAITLQLCCCTQAHSPVLGIVDVTTWCGLSYLMVMFREMEYLGRTQMTMLSGCRGHKGQGASVQTLSQVWMWPLCKTALSGSTSCCATAELSSAPPFPVLPKHGPSLAGLNIPVLCNLYHFLP